MVYFPPLNGGFSQLVFLVRSDDVDKDRFSVFPFLNFLIFSRPEGFLRKGIPLEQSSNLPRLLTHLRIDSPTYLLHNLFFQLAFSNFLKK